MMTSNLRLGDFAYKINYDAEIAKDEAEIARLTAMGPLSAALNESELMLMDRMGSYLTLDWLLYEPSRRAVWAALLGITIEEARAATYYAQAMADIDVHPDDAATIASDRAAHGALFALGRPLCERLQGIDVYSEPTRAALLKRAKTHLSRHKRNQKKYG